MEAVRSAPLYGYVNDPEDSEGQNSTDAFSGGSHCNVCPSCNGGPRLNIYVGEDMVTADLFCCLMFMDSMFSLHGRIVLC